MSIHIQNIDRAPAAAWAGGVTRELALWPPEAAYAKRDFLWRVSSAAVELEESDFTPLPDYHRCILLLSGRLTLWHDHGPARELAPFEPYEFDGAAATRSRGRVSDFNLMLRKRAARGRLLVHELGAGQSLTLEPRPRWSRLLFCAQGQLRLEGGGEQAVCSAGDYLLWTEGRLRLANRGAEASRLVIAEMTEA